MRRLRSFLHLDPVERRLLLRAAFLVALAHLGLRRLPFVMLCRMVTSRRRAGGSAGRARPSTDQIAWAVTVASRYVHGSPTCLTRALVTQAMLAQFDFPGRLHFGVCRGARGEVKGHAWVQSEGRIVIGGTQEEIRGYTPLAAFDIETAFGLPEVERLQGSL